MTTSTRYSGPHTHFVAPTDPTMPCILCGHPRNRHWRRAHDALCSVGNGSHAKRENTPCECPGYQPPEVLAA